MHTDRVKVGVGGVKIRALQEGTFIVVTGNALHPITIRVTDMLGRVVSAWQNVSAGSKLYFGDKYLPGIYFVQATQGNQVSILKVVKQPF